MLVVVVVVFRDLKARGCGTVHCISPLQCSGLETVWPLDSYQAYGLLRRLKCMYIYIHIHMYCIKIIKPYSG